jgi:LysM repeat protein
MLPSTTTQELKKLIISPSIGGNDSNSFKAMINPASINHSFTVSFDEESAQGNDGVQPKYVRTEPETLGFDLYLDGTGVIDPKAKPVNEQIDKFKSVTYEYQKGKHEPPVVLLKWGKFSFECRLQSLSIDYTMFSPDGKPLRAKLSTSFISYIKPQDQNAASRQSPDLTHIITVKSGDTLPLLCQKMYGDSSLYLQIAQTNGLVNFRYLIPGTELLFPPIAK